MNSENIWWVWTAVLLGTGVLWFFIHEILGLLKVKIPWRSDGARFRTYSSVIIKYVKRYGWKLGAPLLAFLILVALTFIWLIFHFVLDPLGVTNFWWA